MKDEDIKLVANNFFANLPMSLIFNVIDKWIINRICLFAYTFLA